MDERYTSIIIPYRNRFSGIFSIFPIGCGTLTDVRCRLQALTGPRSMRKNEKTEKLNRFADFGTSPLYPIINVFAKKCVHRKINTFLSLKAYILWITKYFDVRRIDILPKNGWRVSISLINRVFLWHHA